MLLFVFTEILGVNIVYSFWRLFFYVDFVSEIAMVRGGSGELVNKTLFSLCS